MKKITADNRREICDKERECLTRKQELLRGGCWSGRRSGRWSGWAQGGLESVGGHQPWVFSPLKLTIAVKREENPR